MEIRVIPNGTIFATSRVSNHSCGFEDKKVRMQEQPGSMTASELGMEWTNWLGKEKGGEVGEGKAFSNYVEKRVKRKKKNKTRIVDRPNLSDIFKSFDDEGEEEETSERVEPPVKRR